MVWAADYFIYLFKFFKIRFNVYILLSLCLIILSSCEGKMEGDLQNVSDSNRTKSGAINYAIDYPKAFGEEDDLMRMFLPKNMVFSYDGDDFKTEIKNGKVFATSFIGNSKTNAMMAGTMYFNIKNMCNFNEEDRKNYIDSQPSYKIVKTKKTKKIADIDANHAFAINKENNDTSDIYYTDEIKIKSPNWFTPYNEINGVLLEYEIERYGLKMRFTASELIELDSTATFSYTKDFEELSYKDYDAKIKGYFDDLLK